MFTTWSVVEILIRRTVKIAETFQLVLYGMRMYDIHDDSNAAFVCLFDELLEFFRRTETRRSRKEVRYMVAERAIVRMLLDGHNLDAVVAQFGYTRQHIVLKFDIRSYALLLGSHTDMAFVDHQRFVGFPSARSFALSGNEWLGRSPYLCGEDLRTLILHYALCIRRDAFAVAANPLDQQFVMLAVVHLLLGEVAFPYAVANGVKTIVFRLFPVIEVAFDVDGRSVRSPLAEHPSGIKVMQTEIEISGSPIG